nr:hypothetical protein [Tanacetum cinerariifolium]
MLNKDNYAPWSSRIIQYARSRPNGKMIVDSIKNGPYVRRMIATLGEPDLPILVLESFHEQTNEELTENDIKRMDADDQAIQTILLGLPEDVYAAEKKAKLFNEWEKFTSTNGESIESYYHRFMQLMNDLKRNKHFPKNIESNLKFLNNLQPKWKRHVTIVRQTNNLHEADFTQIYDFLKMNENEVNELRAEHLAKSHDPLALMTHSQNLYEFPATHDDQSSFTTHSQQSFPINNKYNPQPSLNQNFMQPPMTSLEDINDPTEAMNATLILFAKAFQLTAPTNNNQRTSSNPRSHQIAQPIINISQDRQTQNVGGNGGNRFGQYAGQVAQNQQGYNTWQNGIGNQNRTGNVIAARAEGTGNGNQAMCYNCRGLGHIARNYTTRPRRRDAAYLQTQLLIAQKEEAGIQLQAENLTSWLLLLDKAPVYDTDGLAEVQLNDNYYDNEIFNMFTQEEQYTDLLEPNPEPQLVPQNDNHVTSVALRTSVTPHVDKPKLSAVTPHSKKLHASISSHSIPQPREFNVVKHKNMISPGMFKINPSQTPRVDLAPDKQSSASIRTSPITNSQRHVIIKENVSSNTVTASSTVYNRRTKKIIEMMNITFDELSAMAFEQNSSRLGLQSMTSGQISSELELTYALLTITSQRLSERDLDILFEPLHNEYLGGRPSVAPRTIPAAPVLQNLQAPTASMSFQDSAPAPTNSSNTPVSSHKVDEPSQQHAQQQRNLTPSPTASAADNVLNAVFEGYLFVNPFATPSTESVVSSTQYVDPSNMHTFYQPYPYDYQWIKDHPLEQVIREPSRPVLTRSQLKTDSDICIYALTVSIMELKSVKEALIDPAWIESMQEKLHQFIRLDVWELVPSPNGDGLDFSQIKVS